MKYPRPLAFESPEALFLSVPETRIFARAVESAIFPFIPGQFTLLTVTDLDFFKDVLVVEIEALGFEKISVPFERDEVLRSYDTTEALAAILHHGVRAHFLSNTPRLTPNIVLGEE